jgi:hypothetical protein
MRFLIVSCVLLACAAPLGMGQAYSPFGFHSVGKYLDITAETMTRDDTPAECIQLKGRIVVHTPSMDLYADELTPTPGCGGFVVKGNVRIKLLPERGAQ